MTDNLGRETYVGQTIDTLRRRWNRHLPPEDITINIGENGNGKKDKTASYVVVNAYTWAEPVKVALTFMGPRYGYHWSVSMVPSLAREVAAALLTMAEQVEKYSQQVPTEPAGVVE